jgi:hypothetical protein
MVTPSTRMRVWHRPVLSSPTAEPRGREPAPEVSSSPAAPALTQLPGRGFTGELQATDPERACRHVLARRTLCGVANASGALTGRSGILLGWTTPVAG